MGALVITHIINEGDMTISTNNIWSAAAEAIYNKGETEFDTKNCKLEKTSPNIEEIYSASERDVAWQGEVLTALTGNIRENLSKDPIKCIEKMYNMFKRVADYARSPALRKAAINMLLEVKNQLDQATLNEVTNNKIVDGIKKDYDTTLKKAVIQDIYIDLLFAQQAVNMESLEKNLAPKYIAMREEGKSAKEALEGILLSPSGLQLK